MKPLRRMHRKYDTARYLLSCELLREYFPGCAITTDLIVGFPQETEAEFSSTLKFLDTVGFAAMHIFPYSRRTGTPAADMSGQVPMAEKERRAARAGNVEARLRHQYQSQGFLVPPCQCFLSNRMKTASGPAMPPIMYWWRPRAGTCEIRSWTYRSPDGRTEGYSERLCKLIQQFVRNCCKTGFSENYVPKCSGGLPI